MTDESETTTAVALRESGAAIVKAIPIPRELQELGVRFGEAESGTRVVYLPDELRNRVNVIAPVTSYTQADPNWTPGISLVKLNAEEHTYPLPGGKKGLNKQALETLARAAGVLYTRTSRVPKTELQEGELWAYRATVGFRRSDGTVDELTRERGFNEAVERADIEQAVRTSDRFATEEARVREIEKRWIAEMRFGPAKTESKAINRALRAGLGIPSSVPQAALAKAFLVVGFNFTPDYSDPEIKRALVAVGLNAQAAIYGGGGVSEILEPPLGELEPPTPRDGSEDIAASKAEKPASGSVATDDDGQGGDGTASETPAAPVAASSAEDEPSLDEEEPTHLRIPDAAIDAAGEMIAKGDKTVAQIVDAAAGGDAKTRLWLGWAVRNLVQTDDDQRRGAIELYATQRHADLWAEIAPEAPDA